MELIAASLSDIGLRSNPNTTQQQPSHSSSSSASGDHLSRGNTQRTTMSSEQTGLTLFAEWIDYMLGPKVAFEGDQLDDMEDASNPAGGRDSSSARASSSSGSAGGTSSTGVGSSGVGKGAAVVSQGTMEFACLALCDR